jgi:hypothetical protein
MLTLLIPSLFALSAFGITYAAADWLANVIEAIAERLRRLTQTGRPTGLLGSVGLQAVSLSSRAMRVRRRLSPLPILMALAGVGGALLARDLLVSPALLALGLAGAFVLNAHAKGRQTRVEIEAVQTLVDNFESMFLVHRSAFAPLQEAVALMEPSRVREAVESALDRHRLGRPTDECLRPLRSLGSQFADEFVFILERVPVSDETLTLDLLRRLSTRLRQRRTRANRAKVTTARLISTVRVLQGALAAALAASLWFDLWRAYWLASLGNRALFVAMVLAGLGMSAYFEQRVQGMQEEFA